MAQELERELTDEQFRELLSRAYSYESRAGHGAEGISCNKIGEIFREDYKVELYRDEVGDYWYRNMYFSGNGKWITQEEKIFGGYRSKRRYA